MTLDSMNKLADDYILSNGMVNYLYCFRNYLGDITSMGSSSGAAAAAACGSGNVSTGQLTSPSDSKPLHPWDYEYKREKHGMMIVFVFFCLMNFLFCYRYKLMLSSHIHM